MLLAFLTIASLHLLAVISPGPDFAMVVKNSLLGSRRCGIYTAMGVALAVAVHCSYCILGLAIIITQSLLLFTLIKYAGASYLIYIGLKSIFAKKSGDAASTLILQQFSKSMAIKQGFFCNLLNPKATLFFLGLFTLVVNPHTPMFWQLLYALEMILMTFIWFSLVSSIIAHPRIKQRLQAIQHYTTKVMGVFLLAFGCKLALLTQH